MITFKQYLKEARRNPEMNPKIGVVQALEKYKDDPDIYISFTNVDKIGINPQSNFNTPLGIYTYPLKEMWRDIVNDTIPYAGKNPYIWVLKSKNKPKFIKDMYKDYSSKDYDTDMAAIRKMFSKQSSEFLEYLEYFISKAINSAKINNPVVTFWNITREITLRADLSSTKILKSAKPLVQWNELLRKLGYTGFADKSGKGIIHESEPIQAVFLSKDAFTVIEKVLNKRHDGMNWDGGIWKKGIWKNGMWKDGTWEDGTWKDGIWKKGTWIKGWWETGIWENGVWRSGNWVDGTWMFGKWDGGTWESGTWMNGIWIDGEWSNGTWKKGTWKKGTWEDGVWENGLWQDGTWEKGSWTNGKWMKGTWERGSWRNGFWVDGKWMDGNWRNGVWNDGTWEKGTWYNGDWYNGIWKDGQWIEGTWNGGKWFGGKDKDGNYHGKDDSPDKW